MNLITGGTGLVGAHLLLFLIENNEKVRAIYRTPSSLEKTKALFRLYQKEHLFSEIQWVKGDINDIPSLEKAFENVDYVYHCAAYVSLSASDNLMYKTNIEGTSNMVNLSIEHNVKKFCYVSSIAALGNPPSANITVTEETEWNPNQENGDYSITKFSGEMEVFRGSQEGLDVVIVNPGIIIGPEFWNQGSGKFFDNVKKGMKFYTKGTTGFVAVTDVVKAMFELMKSPITSDKFILVSDNLSFQEFLNKIAQSIGAKAPQIHATPFMTYLAVVVDKLISTLFFKPRAITRYMCRSAHSKTKYSSQKIKDALNFTFTDINTYIEEVGKYYLQTRK